MSPVVPHVDGKATVRCQCGSSMSMERYVQFPSGHRWHYWRCDLNRDHVTAALPDKQRKWL